MSDSQSENTSESDIALPADDLPVEADPSFTLPAKRLAGSPGCLNCGTDLQGPFCHFCGQPDRNFLRFFPVLLREFLEDFLDLDSRFTRTMKPLLFQPGRLTRDYLEGRRFRYTPPMRLYLFASIAMFLLAALLSANAIDVNDLSASTGSKFEIVAGSDEERAQIEETLSSLPEGIRGQIDLLTPEEKEARDDEGIQFDDIQLNDEPWDKETNPVAIPLVPQRLNDWINNEIERSPEKAEMINANPNLIVDQVFDILPGTMFVLLPVVALILKFWYLFAKRFYIEHLIHALHNHAFIFVILIISLLLEVAEGFFADQGWAMAENIAIWLGVAAVVWIPIYLLISLRVIYRQNWFLTIGKYFVIGISYMTLLIMVTTFVAILSFLLL